MHFSSKMVKRMTEINLLKSFILRENCIEISLLSQCMCRTSYILTEHCNLSVSKKTLEDRKEKNTGESLTNIILNIQMVPIVITDSEIKFTSSDMSMTGDSIG